MASGEIFPLSRRWLVASILAAVPHQPNNLWWARQVSGGVLHFIQTNEHPPFLGLDRVENIIGRMLGALSGEPPKNFKMLPPPPEIFLPSLARDAGTGWELGFMPALRERIEKEALRAPSDLYLRGLRECVKLLCGTQRWKTSCQTLEEEILAQASHALAKVTGTSGIRRLWVV
jgi:hypothetical protein